jgi:hypothetical protein
MELKGSPTRTAVQRLNDMTGLSWSYGEGQYRADRITTDRALAITEKLADRGIVASTETGEPGQGRIRIPGTETDRLLALDVKNEGRWI